jgi:hypothetical protein
MTRASTNELRAWVWHGFDYRAQLWVADGIVVPCQHLPASGPCCAQRRWAGQPITAVSEAGVLSLWPAEPCPACAPIDRLAPARRQNAATLRRTMPPGAPCWLCHGAGAIAPARLDPPAPESAWPMIERCMRHQINDERFRAAAHRLLAPTRRPPAAPDTRP